MMFDMFDALATLRKEFGEESEVAMRNDNLGIIVRLRVFKCNEWHHHEFVISHAEMDTDQVAVATVKWKHSIGRLHMYIDNYKPPPD